MRGRCGGACRRKEPTASRSNKSGCSSNLPATKLARCCGLPSELGETLLDGSGGLRRLLLNATDEQLNQWVFGVDVERASIQELQGSIWFRRTGVDSLDIVRHLLGTWRRPVF